MVKNKRGWIRIVEALVAILLISSLLVIVIDNNADERIVPSEIYSSENQILREIQSNETFRNYILNQNVGSGDIEFDNFDSGLKGHIEKRVPIYLNCSSKICSLESLCETSQDEESLYVRSAVISANSETYSPRKIKLFCWEG